MPWEHELATQVLEHLTAAAGDAGLPPVAPASSEDVAALAELRDALVPWGVREDLSFLWSTVDLKTLPAQVAGVVPHSPREALAHWLAAVASPGRQPVNLLQVGAGESTVVVADLLAAGGLWHGVCGGDELSFFAPMVGQWVSVMAKAIEDGCFETRSVGLRPVAHIDGDVYRRLMAERIVGGAAHLLPVCSRAEARWPAHWTASPPDREAWRARQGRPLDLPAQADHAAHEQPLPRALARLGRACEAIGLRKPAVATDSHGDAVADVAARLGPWQLPAELRTLWSSVDVRTIPVHAFDEPVDAASALELTGGGADPANLLLVGYEHHDCLGVDVLSGDGAIWQWNLVDGDFVLFARSLGEWFDLQAELLEAGRWSLRQGGWRDDLYEVAEIALDDYLAALAARLGLDRADELPSVAREADGWPAGWTTDMPGREGPPTSSAV